MESIIIEPALERRLIQSAIEGMNNALTPSQNSNDFRFGASVLTAKENIYSAGQYFSDTYSLTVHAEQAALIHAAAHGEYNILAIAIIHNKSLDEVTYPCLMCKQLLYESFLRSKLNIQVLLLNSHANIKEKISLLDMISYAWPKAPTE